MAEAIAYAIEIARALGCAHARHIVHRDVKPQNVLIDDEGSAKVTDFGIARTLDEDGLTADGRVLGTTDYVSPEQALGHDVNGQSDIYSLGIVLYEMLTGDVPFHGENQVAVAMKHVREELPDVQSRRPEVSASLAAGARPRDREGPRRAATRTSTTLIADLEDVLAIEAARSGRSTGEATARPADAAGVAPAGALPFRMRHPLPVLGRRRCSRSASRSSLLLLAGRRPHAARHRRGHRPGAGRRARRLASRAPRPRLRPARRRRGAPRARRRCVVDRDPARPGPPRATAAA